MDCSSAARTSAFATVTGLAASIVGGPVAGVVVGFLAGLPLPLVLVAALGPVIYFFPVTGVWLGVVAVMTAIGFVLGVIRKPPPGFGRSSARRRRRRRWRMSLDPVVAWDPHAVTRAQEPQAITGRTVRAISAPRTVVNIYGITPAQLDVLKDALGIDAPPAAGYPAWDQREGR